MTILYEDKWLVCDDDAITIKTYYFPIGSKRIPYTQLKGISEQALTAASNYRIWGASDPRYWFHLDTTRPQKNKALILDKGDWVKAVITPQDPDRVLQILREKTGTA